MKDLRLTGIPYKNRVDFRLHRRHALDGCFEKNGKSQCGCGRAYFEGRVIIER